MSQTLSAKEIVETFLQIQAIKINPKNPFTYASGNKGPIYCDGRLVISRPEFRGKVADTFAEKIKIEFPGVEVISGVATGSIAIASLVADRLNLPLIYYRKPKDHGTGKTVEGVLEKGQKVVVIEDTANTGGSSLAAINGLKQNGAEVLGLAVQFTYSFPVSIENFKNAGIKLLALSSFADLITSLESNENFKKEEIMAVKDWFENPKKWSENYLTSSF